MSFLAQYGLFALKMLTFVLGILVVFSGFFSLSRRSIKPEIQIDSLNELFEHQQKRLQKSLPDEKKSKKIKKHRKAKKSKKTEPAKSTRFVLDFHGDIHASEVSALREEISMILTVATPKDEVVVRLESPGGAVSGYGLAASQLARLREKNIPLTVCIDKVAASGGYLMACVANQVIAAPFAIIGSIGVVAQMPNIHRLLKKNNIDIELLTAGKYKRTLTVLGENTKKGREKFQEDLEAIHHLFQTHVSTYRKKLDLEQVATGEHWLAKDAIALKLVDTLKTSDDYLYDEIEKYNTILITSPVKQTLIQKIMKPAANLFFNYQL